MFFIGLFGINSKAEPAGLLDVGRCPVCGGERALSVTRQYQSFSAFFVPLAKFGSKYFATCPGCASVFSVPEEYGKRAAAEGYCAAPADALTVLRRNAPGVCPVCGARYEAGDAYCRRCGNRL